MLAVLRERRVLLEDGENYVVWNGRDEKGYIYHRAHSPSKKMWRWERWDGERKVIERGASKTLADAALTVLQER